MNFLHKLNEFFTKHSQYLPKICYVSTSITKSSSERGTTRLVALISDMATGWWFGRLCPPRGGTWGRGGRLRHCFRQYAIIGYLTDWNQVYGKGSKVFYSINSPTSMIDCSLNETIFIEFQQAQ